jgi:hypothetical protein
MSQSRLCIVSQIHQLPRFQYKTAQPVGQSVQSLSEINWFPRQLATQVPSVCLRGVPEAQVVHCVVPSVQLAQVESH